MATVSNRSSSNNNKKISPSIFNVVNILLGLFCLATALHASLVAAALELPPQLLNSGDSNLLKPKEYAPFPLASDVDVELPLDVDVDETSNGVGFNEADQQQQQTLLPPWLQLQPEPQAQRISSGKAFIKVPQHKQHGLHHQTTSSSSSSHGHSNTATHNERRCSIEISSKIPGVCQPMSHIGSACVSGEYMEVFNAECM